LSHIREVDLICQVLRCFPEKEIVHVEKSVDPQRDYEIIQLELILADLQQVERRLTKLKIRDEKAQKEQKILQLIRTNLIQGISLNQLTLNQEEKEIIKTYNFLTAKPFFLLFNYSGNESEIKKIAEYATKNQLIFFPLAVKLESQTQQLTSEERKELELEEINFAPLTKKIKELLKLKIFFTVGADEVKSWLTPQETEAKKCAGLIHSDLQKGFIQVEVYNYAE
jgi:ribosome-binding ATPase YchF (GTP1/OBG family)